MSMIIMVHADTALKEYFLPAVNNTDYVMALENDLFCLGEDLEVGLEVVGNEWSFLESKRYRICDAGGTLIFGKKLTGEDLCVLEYEKARLYLLVIETEKPFHVFQKFDISKQTEIDIGSQPANHIQYSMQNYISRHHAVLQHTGNGWVISDKSSNGTFLNEKRLRAPQMLNFGDKINIFGLCIVYLGDILAVGDSFGTSGLQVKGLTLYYQFPEQEEGKRQSLEEKRYFKRSPRNMEPLYSDEIEIEAPPALHNVREKPVFMIIGPSFTMSIPMLLGTGLAIFSARMSGGGGAYMFTGIITALGSAVLGVMWALANLKYNRQMEREDRELRYNAYGRYLIEIADNLRVQYDANQRILNERYLPGNVCCGYDENTTSLWNRNFSHADFLAVRLGLGSMPFQVQINVPKKKFEMVSDDLKDKPLQLKQEFETLYQVPVCVDLMKENLIGIVGGRKKAGAINIALNMAAQIAVNNCYTDVKMAFLYDKRTKRDGEIWNFARWLPHVWTEGRKMRLIAENKKEAGDIGYELAQIFRNRMENAAESSQKSLPRPQYILFVEDLRLLEGETLASYALNPREEYGLTTVLLVEKYEELPNCCEYFIRNDSVAQGLYYMSGGGSNGQEVSFDTVDHVALEGLSRRLSGIEVNETENSGEIPTSLDFLEMYGVTTLRQLNVLERWTKNRSYDSMKALIGKKGGGADCYLDIHEKYHGPHGLVAGTTGSGKSETLQTYMLSLAVNFSPDDIGFFIIDFKGGGMANLFSGLPHLMGQISNLSGNQIRRAMISIKSEINRRQRLFAENGVNNINLYTRLYKNGEAPVPIPHLFIIIDEFAELKREEPEFMKELISVAQVGRSLGVHLILATQKPAGTVDDNIWSNSKFRLCLRVQDRQDSNDMLHRPDAAYITQAGRCYLQVGNDEIFELFQSGYSGGSYEEDVKEGGNAIATMLNASGRTAIVGNALKRKRKEKKRREWLSFLRRFLLELAEERQVSLTRLASEEDLVEYASETLADRAKGEGFPYEDSPSNRARLREFAELLLLYQEMEESQAISLICDHADKMNRKLPELRDSTQLEAVVKYLGEVAAAGGYRQAVSLWQPLLPESITLSQLEGYENAVYKAGIWPEPNEEWSLDVPIGLLDDPENQVQVPLRLNLSQNGHHVICGTVVTGKSTFLQTWIYALINKYSPQSLNLYILDYSSHILSCFERAPHVGGIVYQEDVEKVKKFFHMLDSMLEERKKLLQGGNYSQYIQRNGLAIPAIAVVIDNYAAFREKTENQFENMVLRLSREGVGYGFFFIASSAGFGASEIPGRIADNIRTVVSLEMGDRFKLAEVMRVPRVEFLPESDVKGRGLAEVDGRLLEFQTALVLEAENGYERSEKIAALCEAMRQTWKGKMARRIPQIPEKPVLQDFMQTEEYRQMLESGYQLPIGYRMMDASYYGVDLRRTYCFLVTGKARTGKTNLLKTLICAVSERDGDICVIENGSRGELRKVAQRAGARYLVSQQEIFDYFKETVETFKKRNLYKRSLLEQGMDDLEIYGAMQKERPVFIFLADVVAFVQGIYKKLENGSSMSGYLENITEKGRLHNFYFFGCLDTDESMKVSAMKVYANMAGYRTGIHLGGNLSSQKIFQFTSIPFSEQTKSMKLGLGLAPDPEDASLAETIVIPQAKGF